jgi:hypothetical protein
MSKLERVKEYIDINKKRPLSTDKNKNIKSLNIWTQHQISNYKIKKQIMENEEIYNLWTEFINDDKYKEYFVSNEDNWKLSLQQLKEYIDKNDKRPSSKDKNKDIKILSCWISNQTPKYKNRKEIMKNEEIYNIWTEFINDKKYKEYFISNEDNWKLSLQQLKEYIDKNSKRPYVRDKNKTIKTLAYWLYDQIKHYNKNNFMSNKEISNKWKEFINNPLYKTYFLSNEERWYKMFNNLKEFIDKNKYKPIHSNKNENIRQLGQWLYDQQKKNYKNKKNIMKNEEIYNTWTNFINDKKYKEYFI